MARYIDPAYQFLDGNGDVLASANLYFYYSRTNELRSIYSDTTLETTQTNPVVTDSAGRITGGIFLGDIYFRVVLRDANGVLVWSTSDGQPLPFIRDDDTTATFVKAPVLTLLEETPISFAPSDADIAVSSTIVVTDADNANLASAQVAINTSGFVSGEDVLTYVTVGSITGAFNSTTGIMQLTGTDTVANYQLALRAVKFQNAAPTPTGGPRSILFTVVDTDGYSTSEITTTLTSGSTVKTPAVREVIIQGGVSPVLAAIESADLDLIKTLTVDIDTAITATLTVADSDSANISSAYAQIISGYVKGEDILQFTDTATITGVFNTATGTMNLTGADTKANYQAALRAIDYFNSTDPASEVTRAVRFEATDSEGNTSNNQDRNITIFSYCPPSETTLSSFASPAANIIDIGYDENTGNMVSIDATTAMIYIHDGISASITTSFASPGPVPSGITVVGGSIYSMDSNTRKIYVHTGLTATTTSNFSTIDVASRGLSYDGSDLLTSVDDSGGRTRKTSLVGANNGALVITLGSVRGICWDGTNMMVSSDNGPQVIKVYDEYSATVIYTLTMTQSSNGIRGMTSDGVYLYSCDQTTNLIYKHARNCT
tara:strand:- start:1202 stop:3013 length:1812 start_codon:yes stop_codon:yes gene_type:complete